MNKTRNCNRFHKEITTATTTTKAPHILSSILLSKQKLFFMWKISAPQAYSICIYVAVRINGRVFFGKASTAYKQSSAFIVLIQRCIEWKLKQQQTVYFLCNTNKIVHLSIFPILFTSIKKPKNESSLLKLFPIWFLNHTENFCDSRTSLNVNSIVVEISGVANSLMTQNKNTVYVCSHSVQCIYMYFVRGYCSEGVRTVSDCRSFATEQAWRLKILHW